ncbi:hypothetical protein [Saccharopolyspora elongata]|uniref:Uncharacterized protein n=1 Tax=Saccharopolyspora elongata TaxID=2530387 RepID=A0A4R4YFX0_9PSEU|nr:hypothetical protein [Saccharopolyspora elongata]TDD43070.1 hypothetical protein E1288_27780 [Saccharopolyspora elongata]
MAMHLISATPTPLHPRCPTLSAPPKATQGIARDDRSRVFVPVSTSVRICRVDPAADVDEIVTAVVRTITTVYAEPGDRVLIADVIDPHQNPIQVAQELRDRLVQTVLRLGRGATAAPCRQSHRDHDGGVPVGGPTVEARSQSGLGPGPRGPVAVAVNRTGQHGPGPVPQPSADWFTLIITGCTSCTADPNALSDWVPMLAHDGLLIVITPGIDLRQKVHTRSGDLCHAAEEAGLALTGRLILTYRPSAPALSFIDQNRSATFEDSRCVGTTAWAFHRSSSPEAAEAGTAAEPSGDEVAAGRRCAA